MKCCGETMDNILVVGASYWQCQICGHRAWGTPWLSVVHDTIKDAPFSVAPMSADERCRPSVN